MISTQTKKLINTIRIGCNLVKIDKSIKYTRVIINKKDNKIMAITNKILVTLSILVYYNLRMYSFFTNLWTS